MPAGRSVTRRTEADGWVIARLSAVPAAAVTLRVDPETVTAAVRTVNERDAGVGSAFPAVSVAWTSKLCDPSASGATGVWVSPGPEQGANGSESKRHSKLEPGSEDENPKVGVGSWVVPEGPESIVVSGGVVSGEKELTSERVTSPPAGIVIGQLRPAALSSAVAQSHVSGKLEPSMSPQIEAGWPST